MYQCKGLDAWPVQTLRPTRRISSRALLLVTTPLAKLEIEEHFSVLDVILKVGVAHDAADGCGHVRKRQIVRGDHSNCTLID